MIRIATAAAAVLALAACHSKKAPDAVPTPSPVRAETPAPKPSPRVMTPEQVKQEQQQVHENVESAMAKIPPQLREPFQKVWNCQAAANGKGGQQVDMDGDWIVRKTAELQSNPSIANCS